MMQSSEAAPSSAKRHRGPTVALVLVDLKSCAPALLALEAGTPRLPKEEALQAMASRASQPRTLRLVAHIALRLLLEHFVGAAAVRGRAFERSALGRPCLAQSVVEFSLSYSGDDALIAIVKSRPIGVDLEGWRQSKLPPARRIRIEAAGAALVQEDAAGVATDEGHKGHKEQDLAAGVNAVFLQAWTRLEAVAKASGLGIGTLLSRFDLFGPGKSWTAQNVISVKQFMAEEQLIVTDLTMGEGKFGALALGGSAVPSGSRRGGQWPIVRLPQEVAALEGIASGRIALHDLASPLPA